jgi:hypothetical protein
VIERLDVRMHSCTVQLQLRGCRYSFYIWLAGTVFNAVDGSGVGIRIATADPGTTSAFYDFIRLTGFCMRLHYRDCWRRLL